MFENDKVGPSPLLFPESNKKGGKDAKAIFEETRRNLTMESQFCGKADNSRAGWKGAQEEAENSSFSVRW